MHDLSAKELSTAKTAAGFFNRTHVRSLFDQEDAHEMLCCAITQLAIKDYLLDFSKRPGAETFLRRTGTLPTWVVDMEVLYERVKRLDESTHLFSGFRETMRQRRCRNNLTSKKRMREKRAKA